MTKPATYDEAVSNLKFAAILTVDDPAMYIDLLRDAVEDLEEAWNNRVDESKRETKS